MERDARQFTKELHQAPYLIDATTNALTSTDDYIFSESVYMGNFNGDGCSDMLVHGANSDDKRQLLIYKGCANGTFSTGVALSSSRYHIPALYPTKSFVTDVNGDGRDDFIVKWRNGNKTMFLTYRGKSDGTFNTAIGTNTDTAIPYYNES